MHGARHRAYVRPPKGHPGIWVSRRDFEQMHASKHGYAVMPDLVHVPAANVVLEVDPDKLLSQPIGIVTKPENIKHVAKYARTERSERNRLVRINDLVTIKEIVWRCNRTRKTVDEIRATHGDFPEPVVTLGNVHVRLWFEVAAWFKSKGLRVRLEGHKPRKGREGAVGNTDAGSD